MVVVYSYSTLTSVTNSYLNNNLNDEEMITSYLMCELHYKKTSLWLKHHKTVWEKKKEEKNLDKTCYMTLGLTAKRF